jgi:DNA-binding transcriptional LysR family regulator
LVTRGDRDRIDGPSCEIRRRPSTVTASTRGVARERQIDIAVTRPPVDETKYDSEVLFEERFVALTAETHPLASRKNIRLYDLASEPFLIYDRCLGPAVYDKTLPLCKAAGVQPRVVAGQPPPYAQAAMMLVASGEGYYLGIASPFTQTHRTSGVAVVPLNERDATLEVRIAWSKKGASGCVREFVRSARTVFPINGDAAQSGAA